MALKPEEGVAQLRASRAVIQPQLNALETQLAGHPALEQVEALHVSLLGEFRKGLDYFGSAHTNEDGDKPPKS